MPLFCLKYVIRFAAQPVLQDFVGPVLYATVAEALHHSGKWPKAMPPETWIATDHQVTNSAPVRKNELVFALFTVAASFDDATSLGHDLRVGLCKLGSDRLSSGPIGGNFCVVGENGGADSEMAMSRCRPKAITPEDIAAASLVLEQNPRIRLQFHSPARIRRPISDCVLGHRFMDSRFFHPDVMLRGLVHRLESLGLLPESLACRERLDAQLTDCNLRWVEVGYGSPKSRKVFGGVVGDIDLRVMNRESAIALQLGTLTGVGELYRMGFGRFSVKPLSTLATVESNSVTHSWI